MADDVVVTNNPDRHRYEAHLDGELAGFAAYHLSPGTIAFTHTEVDDRFEGRGVGSALARAALDDVRDAGGREVLPLCPFIRSWIERHPDYRSLVHVAPDGEVAA
ncbi:GNAT family N-acetyltransferase [Knoellia sp. CPCC 206435]|uniref:GNAT family N-acetyltransferase n=1 Tax=Knoellia terrae TaxID=3404797 RepID=UPI003B4343A5